jgi:hypothetical protein
MVLQRNRLAVSSIRARAELRLGRPGIGPESLGRSLALRMFPRVFSSGTKTGPREGSPGAVLRGSGDSGSGDRLRTCDLWVMSQPVPVSHGLLGLKCAGHDQPPLPAVTVRLTSSRQSRLVSFTNPFTILRAGWRRVRATLARSARVAPPLTQVWPVRVQPRDFACFPDHTL